MTGKQEKIITERIKIYESIKILSETDSNILKKEINKDIILTKSKYNKLSKKINILKATLLLLKNECFINEISKKLNLSTSCIQRYLNDPIIEEELGKEINLEIQEVLSNNLNKGRYKGAEHYVDNNKAIKLENGQFCGSTPKERGKYAR